MTGTGGHYRTEKSINTGISGRGEVRVIGIGDGGIGGGVIGEVGDAVLGVKYWSPGTPVDEISIDAVAEGRYWGEETGIVGICSNGSGSTYKRIGWVDGPGEEGGGDLIGDEVGDLFGGIIALLGMLDGDAGDAAALGAGEVGGGDDDEEGEDARDENHGVAASGIWSAVSPLTRPLPQGGRGECG